MLNKLKRTREAFPGTRCFLNNAITVFLQKAQHELCSVRHIKIVIQNLSGFHASTELLLNTWYDFDSNSVRILIHHPESAFL